jgi:hypothetical protein
MINVTAKTKGLAAILKKYDKAPEKIKASLSQRYRLIGLKLRRESRKNAKLAPPKDPDRGGLEKSILYRTSGNKIYIYVPDNSLAGKYGWLQHDKIRGRGAGTIRKGKRAGWKFIERAVEDNEDWIIKTLRSGFKVVQRDVA